MPVFLIKPLLYLLGVALTIGVTAFSVHKWKEHVIKTERTAESLKAAQAAAAGWQTEAEYLNGERLRLDKAVQSRDAAIASITKQRRATDAQFDTAKRTEPQTASWAYTPLPVSVVGMLKRTDSDPRIPEAHSSAPSGSPAAADPRPQSPGGNQ